MKCTIPYPPRIPLARLPTPLVKLDKTSAYLGVEFYIKRDDLTGVALTGNKVRKLEFLLAEAKQQHADTVITCGGEQSNHCRATALAAIQVGMKSVLLLRTDDPTHPPKETGNILLNKLAGAEIVWITPTQYQGRDQIFAREQARLEQHGCRPYIIPEGGSNVLGAWGYVVAAHELAKDLAELPCKRTTVIHACGSGGTAAGLLIGAKNFDFSSCDTRIVSVNVCDNRSYFVKVIGDMCAAFASKYPTMKKVVPDDIHIVDGYVGRGYALSTESERAELQSMIRRDGIVLDPVYTGKAFYAVVQELKKNPRCFGERIVFVHTGGIFGLLA